MKKYQNYKSYCTGCGLCHSCAGVELVQTAKGFFVPATITNKDADFMSKICMTSGSFWKDKNSFEVWGELVRPPFYAYSNNQILRRKASSGGIISEIAIYLLQNNLVDGIIEIKASSKSQIETQIVVSYSEKDILKCCGSRYTVSSPLFDIKSLLGSGKKYAFIGKPCDVMAVRNWEKIDSSIKSKIPYLISFMCAGLPSKEAETKLLNALKTNEQECTDLIYRGNGWPGYTVANTQDGETGRMTYAESWGKFLGRDIAPVCRFCYDGIGEAADIACGDGWYIMDGKPDFSEHEGRSVVLVRTRTGENIIADMIKTKKITCTFTDNPYGELIQIQNYQYTRRTTMREKVLALKLYHRPIPVYSQKMMRQLGKAAKLRNRMRILLGTLRRLHEKKI